MVATAGGLHIVGDRVYCGVGWSGFYIVDAQSQAHPVVLARHKTVGQVYDLWVEGAYAFLAEGWEGLTIVDISHPTRSFSLGRVRTRGQARGVQVSTNRVYLAEAGGGLTILGLPSAPVTIFEHPVSLRAAAGGQATLTVRAYGREPLSYQWYRGETGDTSQTIAGATEPRFTTTEMQQARAYWVRVSSASGSSDSLAAWVKPIPPVSVELLSVWPGYRRGAATDVDMAGSVAYIAAGGLQIWSLADLASPRLLGNYDPEGSVVSGVCVSEQLAVIACGDRGLEVVDVSNPEAPFCLGRYTNGPVFSIAVVGGYVYGRGGGMLRVLDIADPTHPKEVGTLAGNWGDDIAVQGTYAYLASSGIGLEIVDLSNPAQPRQSGSCGTPGYAIKVDVVGNYVYIADQPRWEEDVRYGGGLAVIDVTDPARPRRVSYLRTDGESGDVSVSDGRAYLADGSAGLKTIDVSSPTAPKLIGGMTLNIHTQTVMVSGQRAYVSAGDAGLQVIDISSPASPQLAGVVETAGFAQDVVVSGQYAYLADGSRGLQILDVGEPQRPSLIGTYPGYSQSVAVAGLHLLFLAPFQALDITNPMRPETMGTLADASGTRVTLAGDLAYLTGDYRLSTVDVSDPEAPEVLAAIPIRGAGNGLAVSESKVFVGCDWSGLQIFDVNVPSEPRRVGTYYPDASVLDVALDGNSAYMTVAEEPGLEVIDIADPQWPVLTSKISLPAGTNVAVMACGYVCVTGDGLRIIDLSDPAHPVCVGQHQLGIGTFGLQVVGNLAYVAAGEYGLAVYRVTPQLILQPPVSDGTELQLSWLGGPGIRLQTTSTLSTPDWQDVPNSDGANGVRMPSSSAASFFRLFWQ